MESGVVWVAEEPWVPGHTTVQEGRVHDGLGGQRSTMVAVSCAHVGDAFDEIAAHACWEDGTVYVSHRQGVAVVVPVSALTAPVVGDALFRARTAGHI